MVDAIPVKNTPVKNRPKKKRPDGLDLDRYKNINTWKYKRWAWEFLRRNSDFIAECKKVDSGTAEEKQKVAEDFGLKKFKKYTESYKGESGYPSFEIGSITSWSNLESDKDKNSRAKIKIGAGQVAIKFDLVSAIEDKNSLKKQLKSAEIRLNSRLKSYEKIIKERAKTHKYKAVNFGIYIRILDLLALNKKPLECAKIIYPGRVKDARTDYYLRQDIKSPKEAAINMAGEGYKYLAILEGKPEGKDLPLVL